ncbi:hypothetical protein GCM10027162_04540 [Streptomyces incanus]
MIAPACERGGARQCGPDLRTGSRDERKLKLTFSLKKRSSERRPRSISDSRSSLSIAADRRNDRGRTIAAGCEFNSRLHLCLVR